MSKIINLLKKLDLDNNYDLLEYFPRKIEFNNISKADDFKPGAKVIIKVLVTKITRIFYNRATYRISFKIIEPFIGNDEYVALSFFPKMYPNTYTGKEAFLKLQINKQANLSFTLIKLSLNPFSEYEVKYRTKNKIKSDKIRESINSLLKQEVKDPLPCFITKHYHLMNYQKALEYLHYFKKPSDLDLKEAIKRFKYQELIKMLTLKKSDPRNKSKDYCIFKSQINDFISKLNFKLTTKQKMAVDDIISDYQNPKVLNRFLIGDVGTGKTIVAFIAILISFLNKRKALFLAPTEILANQHYEDALKLFGNEFKISYLSSSIKNSKDVKKQIKQNDFDLLIGTHSLFAKDLNYQDIGICIIDEQQRFGQAQRAIMFKKANADYELNLSATPIPKSMADILYYGSLNTIIDEYPNNHKKAKTIFINNERIATNKEYFNDLVNTLKRGENIYVIAPYISDESDGDIKTVAELEKAFKANIDSNPLKDYPIFTLHGDLKAEEINKSLNQFAGCRGAILIATSMVEVGINVKHASRILIYSAQQFGRSQIHQLRGRIQRGHYEGICYLLSNTTNPQSIERLKDFEINSDGFKISLLDLKDRGQGIEARELQSGKGELRFTNLDDENDLNLIKEINNYLDEINKEPNFKEAIDNYRMIFIGDHDE